MLRSIALRNYLTIPTREELYVLHCVGESHIVKIKHILGGQLNQFFIFNFFIFKQLSPERVTKKIEIETHLNPKKLI